MTAAKGNESQRRWKPREVKANGSGSQKEAEAKGRGSIKLPFFYAKLFEQ